MGPLPKGISNIMRVTLLAPKFRYLDLTRKSILFLLPPSRGESLIRVTTTLVTSVSSATTPLMEQLLRGRDISGYPFLIRGVVRVDGPLLSGEPGVRLVVGLPLVNPFRAGKSQCMSSTRANGEVACGWNGLIATERVEFNCIEESLFWRSQQAHPQLSFSSLWHPAKISLALETLTHHTLHLAKYPIHVGMSAIALLAMTP